MSRRLFLDIAERVFWTFVAGATSTLLLSGFLDTEAWKAAVVGGVSAVISLVKGVAASRIGDPATAATLPALGPVGTVTGQVVSTAGDVVGEVIGEAERILQDPHGKE